MAFLADAVKLAAIAKASLSKAITWCTTDAAGPSLGLLRSALLDLASLHLAEGTIPSAFACLQAASAAGSCRDALLKAPQALGAVTASAVPAWATQLLHGQQAMASALLPYRSCYGHPFLDSL